MRHEITPKCTIVADNAMGGTLDVVSAEGEVLARFHVPQGTHRASHWLGLLEPGQTLQIGDGCVCFQPRMGVRVTRHPLALKSDANPDFLPTSASRLEREMRIELNEMRSARMALQKEARQRALDKLEVVDAIPEAVPEADAKPKANPKVKPKAKAEDEDDAA